MFRQTVLDNGLNIVTTSMPHALSICLSIFVGAGSRYEVDEQAGVSHFAEHLYFKGTQRRATSREISEAIEGVGGVLNGGTDRELTIYWAKVARAHFPLALDLLGDMLLHSKFDPSELVKEREIILKELDAVHDSPPQRVDMLIDEVIWPGQPLGRDVAGSPETVAALSREDILGYACRQYVPNNVVVAVAGDIDHDQVVESLAHAFGSWPRGSPQPWLPAQDHQEAPRARVERRETEQAYLCLALRGLSSRHPDRFTLDLLNVVLGEGMSSRLFLEIRERRGLAYDVHSYVSHYLDSGSIILSAGVDPQRLELALEGLLQELRRLKEEEVPQAELTKAKELTKGRLLLRMEDTRTVAGWMGAQQLLLGHIRTVEEVMDIVDAITSAEVHRVARDIFLGQKLNLAVVGPVPEGERLPGLLTL